MDTRRAALGLHAGSPLRGTLAPPGSKSIAQRALVAAALAHGRTRLVGLPDGGDASSAFALVAALGCTAPDSRGTTAEVVGHPPSGGGPRVSGALQVGESGTLARLATAALALAVTPGRAFVVEARGTLLRRSSQPLFDALRAAGVRVVGSGWPAAIEPAAAPVRLSLVHPMSSQEVSALLLALAAWPGRRALEVLGAIPSRPYVELTRAVLARFGARIAAESAPQGTLFSVEGPLEAPGEPLRIEPDASSAAVALAAGCLTGGEVFVPGLDASSAQGDVRILEHLRAFGCEASSGPRGLVAGGFPRRGADLDLSGEPDLAPVLAVVAACAAQRADPGHDRSVLTGLGTLPGKESSRIEVLARGLAACGWSVEAGADRLAIGAPRPGRHDDRFLEPDDDHRMAFAFALLGLLRDGVLVRGPGCVAKSWPRFWEDMSSLGAKLRGA